RLRQRRSGKHQRVADGGYRVQRPNRAHKKRRLQRRSCSFDMRQAFIFKRPFEASVCATLTMLTTKENITLSIFRRRFFLRSKLPVRAGQSAVRPSARRKRDRI